MLTPNAKLYIISFGVLVKEVGASVQSPTNSAVEDTHPSLDLQKPIICIDPDNAYQLDTEKERENNNRQEITFAEQQTIQSKHKICENSHRCKYLKHIGDVFQ